MVAVKEFRLPDLGEGLTEAEIVQWLVNEGDTVALNQPLVEVETEKALVEIPSPFAGVVETLHGQVGEQVQVGAVLIAIRVEEDAAGAAEAPPEEPAAPSRREVLVGYGPEEEGGKRKRRRHIGRRGEREPEEPALPAKALATPPVRKLAREMGVDIDQVRGSGPEGRVTREDVVAAATGGPATAGARPPLHAVPSAEGPEEERIPVRAIRRAIAEKMVRSASSIPHVAEWLTVDATELMRVRKELEGAPEAEGHKISPLPIVVKAMLTALRRHPLLNSRWDEEAKEIVVRRVYHVGVATDTDRGLLVPVAKNADRLTIFELAAEIARLVGAARDGSIGPGELTGSTITVTNVGSFGMEAGTPIINHPECAILAVGVIAKRPWVVNGEIVPRDVMTLSLSFDHRIVDGAEAGRFLRYLADLIERPARLFGAL
jgi:pyruvate dehydrogenase E2 component (dihydrolipoamide acetyltransferase)